MKKNSLLTAFLALLILAGVFALVVAFGMKTNPQNDDLNPAETSTIGNLDADAVPGSVILNSDSYDVEWKISERRESEEPENLYYFSLNLETGRYYKMKIKLLNSRLYYEYVYGYEQFGVGFFGERYWEDATRVAVTVERNGTSSEATIYFKVNSTPSGSTVVDFYTHGSHDPEMMSDIDPEIFQMVSFELYCIE